MLYYPIVTRQGADVTLPRKPHTCNNTLKLNFTKIVCTLLIHLQDQCGDVRLYVGVMCVI
jgi:hypothetical protein